MRRVDNFFMRKWIKVLIIKCLSRFCDEEAVAETHRFCHHCSRLQSYDIYSYFAQNRGSISYLNLRGAATDCVGNPAIAAQCHIRAAGPRMSHDGALTVSIDPLTRARYSVIALFAFICQHCSCAVKAPRWIGESTAVEFLQYHGRVFTVPR